MNLTELTELIEAQRQRQCDEVLSAARERAAAIVRQAHRDARQQVRSQLEAERETARHQIHAAEVRRATRLRLQRQQQDKALLAKGWPMLEAGLVGRWRDPVLRRIWAESVFARALAVLPRTAWVIFHPLDWMSADQGIAGLAVEPDVSLQWQSDPGIRAGLRIAAGGAELDGTLDGLLMDRLLIEAQLLARMEHAA